MSILKVDKLVKKFGGLTAVDQVSFEVERGEIFAIIGPNGAGKTTCFNMIAGTFPATSGSIIFDNQDIRGKKPHQLNRMGLARTFQIVKPLAKLTVYENVLVAGLSSSKHLQEAKTRAEEVLEKIGLDAYRDIPSGSLSIGNLKKLELARALATKPKLLLIDEPMGGLTPAEIDQLILLIKEINQEGVTIVIIEHIMRAVMALAERIAVLQNGRLIALGKPEEIVENEKVIKAYLGDAYARR